MSINVNDWVVRKNDEEKNKKWPEHWLNTPTQVSQLWPGKRLYFAAGPQNPEGWVMSRFEKVDPLQINPLAKYA